jgi:hypothetical protein
MRQQRHTHSSIQSVISNTSRTHQRITHPQHPTHAAPASPPPRPPGAHPPAPPPSKPEQAAVPLVPNTAPPPPPLKQHVVLGRCLYHCQQQVAADAAQLRLRQLRRDGEMRCRRCRALLGVYCTCLVTLLLRRLLRFAPALGRAGPCFGGGGG